MVCDSTFISASCASLGEITTQGRLVDRTGRDLASFQQKFRVWRGSRVLLLDVELDPHLHPGDDPWNSYYACRFAWPDESSEVFRSVNLTRQPTRVKRFEAPLFVDIEDESTRTTVFTMGLPYHRRIGFRKLDSLLIVRGETARRFTLGIGVDVKQPTSESLNLLGPPAVVRHPTMPPRDRSGWLFHVGSKSVIATAWEPLEESDESSSTERCTGFRVRLLETAGRRGRVTVSAFRPITSAREVDFRGQHLADCQIVDGKFQLDVSAYQWSQIEARWSDSGG
jgi:alpha-mannosidase